MNKGTIERLLKQTDVICQPRHALSTFGATSIDYYLVSPVEEMQDRTRLRHGQVLSEKPKILTPESWGERFSGFGDEAKEFSDWISGQYGAALRALEYNFKNRDMNTQVISEAPPAVTGRIRQEIEAERAGFKALIACPDAAWPLALMKFSLDETIRSFPVNVRDLDRRGLFNPDEARETQRRREIESLFTDAAQDRSKLDVLGRKLHEYGLFSEYEGRFLSFF